VPSPEESRRHADCEASARRGEGRAAAGRAPGAGEPGCKSARIWRRRCRRCFSPRIRTWSRSSRR